MTDNIYHTVKFFVYYSQIFGLNPVILKKANEKNYFKIFWLGICYSLSLAAFLAFSFQFSFGNIAMFAENDSDIMFMHTVCKLVLGPISVGIIFISSALSAKNFCEVINKLSEYDEEFQKNIAHMRYKLIRYVFSFFFLITLGVCSAYFYNEDIVLRKVSERSLSIFEFISFFVSWCLFDIVSWTFIIVVCSFFYLVYKKFSQINIKLQQIFNDYDKTDIGHKNYVDQVFHITNKIEDNERVPTPFPLNHVDLRVYIIGKLKQIRHLHILLVKISQDLNRIFSTRILTIVSLNVILLCFSSFLLILMLVLGRKDSVLMTAVIWVCVRFFPTCVLIAPFCLVANEADKTSAIVHLYMSKIEDIALRRELKIFSMQLNNRKLIFSAHGFFNLDGRTILSVIGASFAYLVVLLQFHMTMMNRKLESNNNTDSNYKESMS